MDMIEYRTMDKTDWARGPWDYEPDKIQWQDQTTGLPCLIVRNWMGALCGYVGVAPGHPWFGKEYDDCDPYPEVHGGLTYSAGCSHGDEAESICHIPAPGESDSTWWLGFDCAHSGDRCDMAKNLSWRERWPDNGVYRDVSYVSAECERLAAQVEKAGKNG